MLLVHNLRRKKEERKSKISHQDSTQDLQKTTGGEVWVFQKITILFFDENEKGL